MSFVSIPALIGPMLGPLPGGLIIAYLPWRAIFFLNIPVGLAGLVTSKMLREGRRYAIVGVFIAAAILTPPDPISMMSLAIPICLLYEISIWCVALIELRRRRNDAQSQDLAQI